LPRRNGCDMSLFSRPDPFFANKTPATSAAIGGGFVRAARGQRGGTLFGIIAGLLLGLVVAAAVAVYVTKSPVPFVDRASRGPDPSIPNPSMAPDPNRALYGRDAAAGMAPSGANIAVAPPAVTGGAPQSSSTSRPEDTLGQLMATLSKTPDAKTPVSPQAPKAGTVAPKQPAIPT